PFEVGRSKTAARQSLLVPSQHAEPTQAKAALKEPLILLVIPESRSDIRDPAPRVSMRYGKGTGFPLSSLRGNFPVCCKRD
ncbi:MAG: hypothetical protein WBW92_12590, partial [Rhodanobacteraceae bacterium]